jgi:diadenosine tetraphosphate (Ap4A) HIT family hydrolase
MRALTSDKCPFCRFIDSECLLISDLSCVIFDANPVTPGHLLLIPKRHTADFFDLHPREVADIMELLQQAKKHVAKKYKPDGFNIGINAGAAAGQTIAHVHIHLIPRYFGDVEDPTGGVRGVIPWKSKYPVCLTTS